MHRLIGQQGNIRQLLIVWVTELLSRLYTLSFLISILATKLNSAPRLGDKTINYI